MTDDEYRAWLARDNEKRCTLVELDYVDEVAAAPVVKTLYFSDRVFFDVVTNAVFVDVIRSAPQFSRALGGEQLSSYASSIDAIELLNNDGQLDFLTTIACDGSPVRFKYGGENWPLSDFRTIYTAIAAKVSAPAQNRISLALKDTGLLLDKSIGGTSTVGGTGANADRPRPVAFGYIHNMTPLLLDQTIGGGKYVYADDGTGATCEQVRDDGVSVAYTDNLDGTFTLTAPPVGLITADVLAEPLGSSNVTGSDALDHIVGTRAGLTAESLYDGAGPTFDVHDADDYKLGILLPEARNVIDLLADVNVSLNAFWAGKRDGKFTFGRLRLNDIASFALTARDIREDDYDDGSFHLEHLTPQYYKYQGYMSRNWTRQSSGLSAALTQDERAQYERAGLYLLQPDGLGTAYIDRPELYHKTLKISPVVDTLLSQDFAVAPADLDEFAQQMTVRRAIYLPWVQVVSMTVGIEFFELELGDPVSLTITEADGATRYGISATLFQVIGIVIRLTDAKIELKLARRTVIQPVPAAWHRTVSAIDDAPPDYGGSGGDPSIPVEIPFITGLIRGVARGGGGGTRRWIPGHPVPLIRQRIVPLHADVRLYVSMIGGNYQDQSIYASPATATNFVANGDLFECFHNTFPSSGNGSDNVVYGTPGGTSNHAFDRSSTDDITIEGFAKWVASDNAATPWQLFRWETNSAGTPNNEILQFFGNAGNWFFHNTGISIGSPSATGFGGALANTLVHWAWVYDHTGGGTFTFYTNGVQRMTGTRGVLGAKSDGQGFVQIGGIWNTFSGFGPNIIHTFAGETRIVQRKLYSSAFTPPTPYNLIPIT